MSEQERKEQFISEYNAFIRETARRLGFTVRPRIEQQQFGDMLQSIPIVEVVAVSNWTPKQEETS